MGYYFRRRLERRQVLECASPLALWILVRYLKAPEDWRTPKRFRDHVSSAMRIAIAITRVLFLVALVSHCVFAAERGLLVTFVESEQRTASDVMVAEHLALYVAQDQSATPFLAPGRFTATWEGFINVDLRSEYFFSAEVSGDFVLEINDAPVLSAAGLSKPVPLKKGANKLRATLRSPKQGDTFVRVGWTEEGTNTSPIPAAALTYDGSAHLAHHNQLRLGRELFLEYQCAKCHTLEKTSIAVPELDMDAPTFEGIGSRRRQEWMARWILDPKALRATVHMPKLLFGTDGQTDAAAIAAFLASLRDGSSNNLTNSATASNGLFERLHCAACHTAPDTPQAEPDKITLSGLNEKFPPGKLAEFLMAPEAHYAWIRMPNFELSPSEAQELATYLLGKASLPASTDPPPDASLVGRGQQRVQTTGCLNCHALKLDNQYRAPKLSQLKWQEGCLSAEQKSESRAPRFQFTAIEREALRAFGKSDRLSLTRFSSHEFATRQTRLLKCNACHGQVEGFPPLERVGAQLKPEWMARLIAGELNYKPRPEKHATGEPWLEARMPAFKSRATFLAAGLAAAHGYPPKTPIEPPPDMKLAEIGRKLVGKDGGFSCVSCHSVGELKATEVFESEGINFYHSAERLQPEYYRRWMRNPLAIDPQTKMPTYFENGQSPLTEILEGDAEKQIDAIWHYLRLARKMPAPASE